MLQDFSLKIPWGQTVGIVGPSGAGKSTILRLIQGLMKPDAGIITIGGWPLANLAAADVANVVSAVTQEVHLLHRTLRENLCYGRPDATATELEEVMRVTGCAAFVNNLPEGLQAVPGERGATLSGGQRQRLALARALLKRAPVLLLDEATASLDSASEADLQRAIKTHASGRTIIAVAHRLSTVMSFDRIIVVEQEKSSKTGRLPCSEPVRDHSPSCAKRKANPWRTMRRAREWPARHPSACEGAFDRGPPISPVVRAAMAEWRSGYRTAAIRVAGSACASGGAHVTSSGRIIASCGGLIFSTI